MLQTMAYKAQQFNLSKLQGISDQTLEMHFKLYEGYVKSVNELRGLLLRRLQHSLATKASEKGTQHH